MVSRVLSRLIASILVTALVIDPAWAYIGSPVSVGPRSYPTAFVQAEAIPAAVAMFPRRVIDATRSVFEHRRLSDLKPSPVTTGVGRRVLKEESTYALLGQLLLPWLALWLGVWPFEQEALRIALWIGTSIVFGLGHSRLFYWRKGQIVDGGAATVPHQAGFMILGLAFRWTFAFLPLDPIGHLLIAVASHALYTLFLTRILPWLPLASAETLDPKPEAGEITPEFAWQFAHHFKYVSLYGLPGIGKGTFSKTFVPRLNRHLPPTYQYGLISFGAILRDVLRIADQFQNGTLKLSGNNGQQRRFALVQFLTQDDVTAIRDGRLISDDAMIKIVRTVLTWPEYKDASRLIFDGFPRNAAQFAAMARGAVDTPVHAPRLDLLIIPEPPETQDRAFLEEKLLSRWREGETLEVARTRFQEYERHTSDPEVDAIMKSDRTVRFMALMPDEITHRWSLRQRGAFLTDRFLEVVRPVLNRLEEARPSKPMPLGLVLPEDEQGPKLELAVALRSIAALAKAAVQHLPTGRNTSPPRTVQRNLLGPLQHLTTRIGEVAKTLPEAYQNLGLREIHDTVQQFLSSGRSREWMLADLNEATVTLEDMVEELSDMAGVAYTREHFPWEPIPEGLIDTLVSLGLPPRAARGNVNQWHAPQEEYLARKKTYDLLTEVDGVPVAQAAHLAFTESDPDGHRRAALQVAEWLEGLWRADERPIFLFMGNGIERVIRRLSNRGFLGAAIKIWLSPLDPYRGVDPPLPVPPRELVESVGAIEARQKAEREQLENRPKQPKDNVKSSERRSAAITPMPDPLPAEAGGMLFKRQKPPSPSPDEPMREALIDVFWKAIAVRLRRPDPTAFQALESAIQQFNAREWTFRVVGSLPWVMNPFRKHTLVIRGVPPGDYRISLEWVDRRGLVALLRREHDARLYSFQSFLEGLFTMEQDPPAELMGQGATEDEARRDAAGFRPRFLRGHDTRSTEALGELLQGVRTIEPDSEHGARAASRVARFNDRQAFLDVPEERPALYWVPGLQRPLQLFEPSRGRNHMRAEWIPRLGLVLYLCNAQGVTPYLMEPYLRAWALDGPSANRPDKLPRVSNLFEARQAALHRLTLRDLESLVALGLTIHPETPDPEAIRQFQSRVEQFESSQPQLINPPGGSMRLFPISGKELMLDNLGRRPKATHPQDTRLRLHKPQSLRYKPVLRWQEHHGLVLMLIHETHVLLTDLEQYRGGKGIGKPVYPTMRRFATREDAEAFSWGPRGVQEATEQSREALRALCGSYFAVKNAKEHEVSEFQKQVALFNEKNHLLRPTGDSVILDIISDRALVFAKLRPDVTYKLVAEWLEGWGLGIYWIPVLEKGQIADTHAYDVQDAKNGFEAIKVRRAAALVAQVATSEEARAHLNLYARIRSLQELPRESRRALRLEGERIDRFNKTEFKIRAARRTADVWEFALGDLEPRKIYAFHLDWVSREELLLRLRGGGRATVYDISSYLEPRKKALGYAVKVNTLRKESTGPIFRTLATAVASLIFLLGSLWNTLVAPIRSSIDLRMVTKTDLPSFLTPTRGTRPALAAT